MGRPSKYSQETADEICTRLAEGESLRSICRDDHMPGRQTVSDWERDDEGFRARCAQARDAQADVYADKILDVADACTNETAQADKVKISAYQWMASKLKPKKYGDKVDIDHSGEIVVKFESADGIQPNKVP